MKFFIQILGVDSGDTTPSILLFLDSHSLLINAGEGIQRFFTEQKIRLRKVHNVLFTRLAENTLGGLPGFEVIWFHIDLFFVGF